TATKATSDLDAKAEGEIGIFALHTRLESHTGLAFDALEAWSLRNIITCAPELPIVTPHHQGLNLREEEGEEMRLMTEIEVLRRKLDVVRVFLFFSFIF